MENIDFMLEGFKDNEEEFDEFVSDEDEDDEITNEADSGGSGAPQVPQKKADSPNRVRKVIKFLNGKKVIKRTCGEGYKYDPNTKRCIKLSPSDLRKMKIASKKRVRKMRNKMGIILRKRAKSLRIRQSRMG